MLRLLTWAWCWVWHGRRPERCHDLTNAAGAVWASVFRALRPAGPAAAEEAYRACDRCGSLVRGAHTCGALLAPATASPGTDPGPWAAVAIVAREELRAQGIDSPPLPAEVVAIGRSFAGRALRSGRTVDVDIPLAQLELPLAGDTTPVQVN